MIELLLYLLSVAATGALVVLGWIALVAIVLTIRKRVRKYATKWVDE